MKGKVFFLVGMVLILMTACSGVGSPKATPTPGLENYPLAETGSYLIGRRTFTAHDPKRSDRAVIIYVWYPALKPAEDTGATVLDKAAPDMAAAPYPVIISSSKMAGFLAPFLVSRGFAWVSVAGLDAYPVMKEQMVNQPLDILFALGYTASNPPAGLEGVLDVEHAGAIGYSFDGYNALAMSGARIDPAYYLQQCPTPDSATKEILGNLSSFNCSLAESWDNFNAYVGDAITVSDDGLWQPMTDKRIRAVMPMAAEGWWLFGEKGLAAEKIPYLTIVGEKDELYKENALIFENLGTMDKTFITVLGKNHFMMVEETNMTALMAHFATAFFGYYLQGRQEYKQYFSESVVSNTPGLFWGIKNQ